QGTLVSSGKARWIYSERKFRRLQLPGVAAKLLEGAVRIGRDEAPIFLSRDWPELVSSGKVESDFKVEDFRVTEAGPEVRLQLTGGLAILQGQLQFGYPDHVITVGVNDGAGGMWIPNRKDVMEYFVRDLTAEQEAKGRLLRAGFEGPQTGGIFHMKGQEQVITFFARHFARLQSEWVVKLEERLEKSAAQNIERIEPLLEVRGSGEQWFDLQIGYRSSGGEQFSSADIQRLLRSGQSHTRLKNGRIAVIDTGAVEELQEVLLDCAPEQRQGGYRISSTHAGFFTGAVKELGAWKFDAPQQWRERAGMQRGEIKPQVPALGKLDGLLREYQKEGVAWLAFLRQNRFGGILADEMGLGKTLQTLALLQSNHLFGNGARGPSLVICPTSLVQNWEAEAKRFVPELRTLVLQGSNRQSRFSEVEKAHLVITSYGLVRRDAEEYRKVEFDTVVLDEAQHIKNRQTQNAQAVKMIRAGHRLALTGTPLENSVLDLWSMFDFLMPGYLGSAKDFKERYEVPITRDKNVEAQKRLSRRVKPFLLRRLKKDVARELPDKIEQIAYCELTEAQRGLYQQMLETGREQISDSVRSQGIQKSRLLILNVLLRLRQICCDMRLLNLEKVEAENSSAKLELFNELLQEIIDGGHRVLVFSQFVRMLKLIEESLKEQEVRYSYLDGSTSNRAAVVNEFQTSREIPVFLISLKAGGVGLNLTAADTVVHFDPWWNPAVEDQATDRAHRIGQTRVVTSYKLITRGTVEEKIVSLQNRKREIIRGTLGSEEEFAAGLSWEELEELLG
ncbi:MAG: SNF2-related protein, partial [Verrucomicrobiota bacterium]|nr:SNF2-related protein [Verrucomicrobiota bacterium]